MDWNLGGLSELTKMVILNYGLKILAAIAILILGRILSGIAKSIILKTAKRSKTDTTISSFVANIAYYAFLAFFIVAALGQLGIETTSFIAILGAAGLAIALAFQGSLSNFAAGFLIILFRPFKVGDYIDGGGVSGSVKEIQIFTTILTTPDNKKVIIPNAKLTSDNITNYSTETTRRIDINIGVGYTDDLEKTKNVLNDILSHYPEILSKPKPLIAISNLGESSVDIIVRPWVNNSDYWNVYYRITEEIKNRFDTEGISIPYPQRDLHVFKKD
ncbi:MAG: mechanosensitive ion channel [Candidatus Marinimicrobia bacterium]|nr:mechanosensitive ion channel [Candidatus Neomarinimicrobiota bacterium]